MSIHQSKAKEWATQAQMITGDDVGNSVRVCVTADLDHNGSPKEKYITVGVDAPEFPDFPGGVGYLSTNVHLSTKHARELAQELIRLAEAFDAEEDST